jgi:aspartate kinase
VANADAMRRAVAITERERGANPVVVTSACAGVTDELLNCATFCGEGAAEEARAVVGRLVERHLEILHDMDRSPDQATETHLRDTLHELGRLVEGVILLGELTPRTVDVFAGFGERLSSILLRRCFEVGGWRAHLTDSRRFIVTDGVHGSAHPLMEHIEMRAPEHLLPAFNDHEVIVAQGFIGSTVDGITTTIGRGGSDHTGALVGGALGSREIQIWTDVSGILTADPRSVPDARVIAEVTFSEARELAYFGAKVIHPDTILPALKRDIPVVIKNSKQPEDPGTRILPDDADVAPGIHSVTLKRGIALLRLSSPDGTITGAMSLFDTHNVPLQCALVSERHAVVAVERAALSDVLLTALSARCEVEIDRDRTLVALIGVRLRQAQAVLTRPFEALRRHAIPFVAAGASDHSVLLAVPDDDATDVLVRLHAGLFEANPII